MMKVKSLLLIACMLMGSIFVGAQTKVISHRGYWKAPGAAQNSLASLTKADSIHCFGSEFDVWITSDGTVMVNHDPVYDGVRLETATFNDVKNLKLKNGEVMPTFKNYLKQAKKLNVNLICEIKTHKDINRQNACIDATLALVKKMKMEKRMTYIAFSLDATKRLISEVPQGTEVYYLNGDLSPKELQALHCSGPDYQDRILKAHPEWIKGCQDLGMKVNVWTVNTPEDLHFFIDKGVDYITTNEPVLLQSMLSK
jgi:glycerophosphoryl diester phosphodiesterase